MKMVGCDTTIAVTKATKEKLQGMKVIEDETYDHLISRIIDEMDDLEKQTAKKRGKNKKLEI